MKVLLNLLNQFDTSVGIAKKDAISWRVAWMRIGLPTLEKEEFFHFLCLLSLKMMET